MNTIWIQNTWLSLESVGGQGEVEWCILTSSLNCDGQGGSKKDIFHTKNICQNTYWKVTNQFKWVTFYLKGFHINKTLINGIK